MNEILHIEHLSKRYGSKQALDNVNLRLERGGVIGLLGPNGSGKTTMIKLIAGLLTPNSGHITVDGSPIGTESREKVAYLPDHMFLAKNMTIEKQINYFCDFFLDFDRERAYEMIASLGLKPTDRIGSLSKGNKEKVALILTMSRRAKLYLLDEPIAGVDPATRDYILRTIVQNYAEDSAVVISTHLISDIESVLDRVFYLQSGHIVLDSTPDDIRANTGLSVDEHFREVFKW